VEILFDGTSGMRVQILENQDFSGVFDKGAKYAAVYFAFIQIALDVNICYHL
jgi:hypothetical protein